MSFYYFFQAPLNAIASLPPLYYLPAEPQLPPTNLILMNPTHPSQMEQKQNYILHSNLPTRDSLPQEFQDAPKPLKKKKMSKKEKDESFGWRNQNKDRNILSNILKAFINYCLEHQGMKDYIHGLTSKLNFQSGVSGFYTHLASQFPSSKSYISPKQLRTLLHSPAQDQTFLLLLKIALLRFLKLDYSIILLKSTKIKKRSKLEQMKRCRELISLLFRL